MPSFSVGDYDFSFNKEKNGSYGIGVSSDGTPADTTVTPPQDGSTATDNNGFSFGIETPDKKTVKTVQNLVNEKSKSKDHLPEPQQHGPPPPMPGGQQPMMQQQYTGVSMPPQQMGMPPSPMVSPGVQQTVVVTHPTGDAQLGAQFRAQMYAQCATGNHDFETKYGPVGIIIAIALFPIGLFCLGVDAEKRCTRCGEHQ